MILFYELTFIAMALFMAISLYKKSCVNALCLLIALNFLTFLALYHSPISGLEYTIIEACRTALFIVACGVLAFKTTKPMPYLVYSLVLYGFIIGKGLFLINSALIPSEIYVFLTVLEILIFSYGHLAVQKAKTRNGLPDYTNANNDNTTGSRFIGNS